MQHLHLAAAALAALALSSFSAQQPAKAPPQEPVSAGADAAAAEVVKAQRPSYPLTTCPVSGEALGGMGKPHDMVVDGRLVRLCCASCAKKVDKEATFAKIDAAVVAAQKASYPLDVCPISGEKLDATAVDNVVGTRLVRTCCSKCTKEVVKNPRPVLERIDKALIERLKPTYAATTCVVSGEALGADAVDYLYGTRLVRFCCKMCRGTFDKDPDAFLAQIDTKAPAKAAPGGKLPEKPEKK
jgi:hypothetical protein